MSAALFRIVTSDAFACPPCERQGVTIPMCIERRAKARGPKPPI